MTLQNNTAGFSNDETTPPVEAEVEGTGTLEQQTPVADGLATTSPEDSNAQQPTIETLQTQLKKLENDNKALQGRLRSQQKENPQFDELSDNMATLVDTVQALIRHQSTQDQEAYMEDLQKVEANAATRKATNNFTRTANSFIAEIEEIVTESGLDLMTAPELAAFRELWSPAYEKQDLAGIYQAHAEFNRTMRHLSYDESQKLDLQWKRQKFASVKNQLGFSQSFYIPDRGIGDATDDLEVKQKGEVATKAELNRAFKKHMGSKMTNKTVLNAFIEQIA